MKLVQPNSSTPPPTFLNKEKPKQIDQNKYLITSFSKNKEYEVTIIDYGIGACSCPHFTYRNVQCKHIIKVLSYIFLGEGVNS